MPSPYENLYHRLIEGTEDPESSYGCWVWNRRADRYGYGRFELYVPGLKKKVVLVPHLALWVWLEAGCGSADELYLAYKEFRASGLELDHLCMEPRCCNVDHHEPATKSENRSNINQRPKCRPATTS